MLGGYKSLSCEWSWSSSSYAQLQDFNEQNQSASLFLTLWENERLEKKVSDLAVEDFDDLPIEDIRLDSRPEERGQEKVVKENSYGFAAGVIAGPFRSEEECYLQGKELAWKSNKDEGGWFSDKSPGRTKKWNSNLIIFASSWIEIHVLWFLSNASKGLANMVFWNGHRLNLVTCCYPFLQTSTEFYEKGRTSCQSRFFFFFLKAGDALLQR